jgi:hypothetical protein
LERDALFARPAVVASGRLLGTGERRNAHVVAGRRSTRFVGHGAQATALPAATKEAHRVGDDLRLAALLAGLLVLPRRS